MIQFNAKVLREEARHDGEYVLLEAPDGLHRCWMTKAEFAAFQGRFVIAPVASEVKAPEVSAPAPVAPVQVQSRGQRK